MPILDTWAWYEEGPFMTSSGTTAESARSIACQIDGIDTCILNMLEKDGRATLNRTPIIGLKKFGFDDWRCGSFVCVRIGGSTMTTGSGARR